MAVPQLERVRLDGRKARDIVRVTQPDAVEDPTFVARSANMAGLTPPLDRFAVTRGLDIDRRLTLVGWLDPSNPVKPEVDPKIKPYTDDLVLGRSKLTFDPQPNTAVRLSGRFLPLKRQGRKFRNVGAGLQDPEERREKRRVWLQERLSESLEEAGDPGILVDVHVDETWGQRTIETVRRDHRAGTTRAMRTLILNAAIDVLVTDPDGLKNWLATGVGRQKAYGFGIMVPEAAFHG